MRNLENIRESITKENPFSVPEGYFEGLSESVSKRVVENRRTNYSKALVYSFSAVTIIIIAFTSVNMLFFDYSLFSNKAVYQENPNLDCYIPSNVSEDTPVLVEDGCNEDNCTVDPEETTQFLTDNVDIFTICLID